jgi:hypothetical protein
MQSESNYTGIYHKLYKTGLFNNVNPDLLLKNLIPVTRVNQFFFGTNLFNNKLNFVILYTDGIINTNGNCDTYFVYISKLVEYVHRVLNVIDLDNLSCCPYNYYKTFTNISSYPEHYQNMINCLDAFLNYLDTKNTSQAKTIKHIIAPNNKIETEIVDFLNFNNIYSNELLLKFFKKGKPIYIRMYVSDNIKSNEGLLRISNNITTQELEDLYDYITNQLLLDNPEEFLINNLERICGSQEFAELMVRSYLSKNDYIYDIDSLSSIILWKNDDKKYKYHKYFISRYIDNFSITNDEIKINFEGINKFLLNISEDDVINFEVKEQINEMYYKTMHELIYSFELLYKYK